VLDETLSPKALATLKPAPPLAPRWTWAAWLTGIRTVVSEPAGTDSLTAFGEGGAHALDGEDAIAALKRAGALDDRLYETRDLTADTGELRIERAFGLLRIDTPRTAGGYAGAGEDIVAEHAGLRADRLTTPATIFACSLDRQPLRASKRILVSHLTELLDTGMGFAEESRRTLTAWGKLPHLVRAGSARIALTLDAPALYEVWALSTSGARVARVEAVVADGKLTFTADVAGAEGARMCYEVARE
jgi:hypothetical protein